MPEPKIAEQVSVEPKIPSLLNKFLLARSQIFIQKGESIEMFMTFEGFLLISLTCQSIFRTL